MRVPLAFWAGVLNHMQAVPVVRRNDATDGLVARPGVSTDAPKAHALPRRSHPTIRLARFDEAPAIVSFTSAIFRGRGHFSKASFGSTNDVEQLMTQGKFLLAENDRGIIGLAYLEPRMEASRLDLLAVAPSQQRAGIGSQLLEAAERLSSSMQCFFMHVQIMNLHWETIKFCHRRGYMQFGIKSLNRQQPVSPHCHFVMMCKQLDTDRLAF